MTLDAAPWNFTAQGLARGQSLLKSLPYNHDAVAWAEAHFDDAYQARWKRSGRPSAT